MIFKSQFQCAFITKELAVRTVTPKGTFFVWDFRLSKMGRFNRMSRLSSALRALQLVRAIFNKALAWRLHQGFNPADFIALALLSLMDGHFE